MMKMVSFICSFLQNLKSGFYLKTYLMVTLLFSSRVVGSYIKFPITVDASEPNLIKRQKLGLINASSNNRFSKNIKKNNRRELNDLKNW